MSLFRFMRDMVGGGKGQDTFTDTTPKASLSGWQSINLTRSYPSDTGETVDEMGGMSLPVVYSAITLIADSLAQLPIDVMRKVDGKSIKQSDHPLEDLLNRSLNPYMTAFIGRSNAQSHVLGWGNSFVEIERDASGLVKGLWPLLPDRTRLETVNGERIVLTRVGGEEVPLRYKDVLHVPAWGFDGVMGVSPIQMHCNAIGLVRAYEKYVGKFFANDATSGGFLQHPGALSAEALARIEAEVNADKGLGDARRLRVLEEGIKFVPTSVTPEDAELLASRTFQVEEVARIFRIPLHMLQSHSKDTAWGTGIYEQQIGYLVYTLSPHTIKWEQEINRKVFTEEELAAGFYIKHNVSGLLRGNPKERAEMYAIGIDRGWLTVNEVRALEELAPIEGGDDISDRT